MKTTKPAKKRKASKELTLLGAIQRVVEVAKDSQLKPKAMVRMAEETRFLAEHYGISERQAVLFCVCLERGPRSVDYDDLAHFLDVNHIHILSYADDIDALIRRRLLRYRNAKDEDMFDVPQVVVNALKHNEAYALPSRTGLDCPALFEVLDQLFEDLDNNALTPNAFNEEIDTLFEENPQVDFVKQIKSMDLMLNDTRAMLLYFCNQLVNHDDEDLRLGEFEKCFDNPAYYHCVKTSMRNGEHVLIREKLVEYICEDGIANTSRFKLTESAKRTLLGEMKLPSTEEHVADVVKAGDLRQKEMFYVEENRQQVEELQSFLMPEKYNEIRERMQKTGFRTGFACLFYGAPGTGKTETVYQLARQTGRDVMMVDVPQIKSKWVGDSEKNIKALFDRYREMVQKASDKADGLTPILLFNEADGIIGIRKTGAESAVDKMENSIQNIILQEMENLDGIMIATTNLTQNLDSAFERRFLYKIRFEKPDTSVRQHIWQSMMPTLSDNDAHILAEGYDFSGGQIENISRKATINAILHGEETNDLARLTSFCKAEKLSNNTRRIGFGA